LLTDLHIVDLHAHLENCVVEALLTAPITKHSGIRDQD